MNFFICNRYDSQRENLYIISPKGPFTKNNLKQFKGHFLKNLLLEEINNIDKNSISNIGITNNQNPEDSEELQVIEYPYSQSQPFIKLGNRFSNRFKYNSSIDSDKSYYNCFNFDNIEEKNQIRMYRNNKDINETKEINTENDNPRKKFDNKFKLNDSQIDVEDTIKGEDNINISKLKSFYKNFENKRQTHNIKLIPNKNKNKKNKNLNQIFLNDTNKLNLNDLEYNNNTFIKKNAKINILNKSLSKKKKNNTLKHYSKTNSLINTNEFLNTTSRMDKNKPIKSNNPKINLNESKKNIRTRNKNYSNNNNIQMKNYNNKNLNEHRDNINNNKEIIRSIKRKIQRDMVYGVNNNINIKKKKNEK